MTLQSLRNSQKHFICGIRKNTLDISNL